MKLKLIYNKKQYENAQNITFSLFYNYKLQFVVRISKKLKYKIFKKIM